MGLLGLLEPADSEPLGAVLLVYGDEIPGEDQAVRVYFAKRVSTRRPIVAVSTNVDQLIKVVVTQGGQVEIITCVGNGRKARGVDTTAGVAIALVCCTHVGCIIGRFIGVIMMLGLQHGLLLKPHAAFI